MARLSQRAMNNVVIIAMLLMIGLFNLDSLVPKKTVIQSRSLLPQNAYVLKIEQDQFRLERTGQQWRQKGANSVLTVTPQQQHLEWLQASLVPATSVPANLHSEASQGPIEQPYIVVAWLAGNSNGLVYAFYPNTQPILVKFDNNWYELSDATLNVLLPWNE